MNKQDDRIVWLGYLVTALLMFGSMWYLTGCKPVPPTPSPSPTPAVECQCVVPPSEDSGWKGTTVDMPLWEDALKVARDTVGDCSGATPEDNLKLLADQLGKQNICAGQWADAVLIARPDGKWEQWHAFSYATNCWASLSTAFKGAWVNDTASVKAGCEGGVHK